MQATIGGWCGVITDATSTVGRAVAVELGRERVRVAIGYSGYRGADFEEAQAVVREVINAGGEAFPLRLPAGNIWELEQVIGSLAEHWGRLDFVVDLDNRCVFGRAALPWMLKRAKGRIVHIRSAGAAHASFSRVDLAQVAANGIAINSIHLAATGPAEQAAGPASPSLTDAPPAMPDDVATTVNFLLAQSTCMTGQIINLSGERLDPRHRRRPQTLACSTGDSRWRPARDGFRGRVA